MGTVGEIIYIIEIVCLFSLPVVYAVSIYKTMKLICRFESRDANELSVEWIPCSKKNGPDTQEIVLVTLPEYTDEYGVEYCRGVVCAYTITTPSSGTIWCKSDGVTFGTFGILKSDPIAWMPLPKPYDEIN